MQKQRAFVEGDQVGNFRFEKFLGQGAFGEVWRIVEIGSGNIYAAKYYNLKQMQKLHGETQFRKLVEYIDNEFKVLTTVRHPHLLECYGKVPHKDGFFLNLQYCEGGTIEDLIGKEQNPLAENYVSIFLVQIVDLFLTLEPMKIIHRDLKLENILRDGAGRIAVADFGLSKIAESTATVCGTPLTMAPEVSFGQPNDHYTSKVDVWSLGVCIYMMLFGRDPFNKYSLIKSQPISGPFKNIFHCSGNTLGFPGGIRISYLLRDLLREMIHPSPQKRLDWKGVSQHPYLSDFRNSSVLKIEAVMKNPPFTLLPSDEEDHSNQQKSDSKKHDTYCNYLSRYASFTGETAEKLIGVMDICDLGPLKKSFVIMCCYLKKIHFEILKRLNAILNYFDEIVDPTSFLKTELGRSLLVRSGPAIKQVLSEIQTSVQELEARFNSTSAEKSAILESLKKPILEPTDLKLVHQFAHIVTLALKDIWEKTPGNELSSALVVPILKMAIVQISLCLTYQQAMEFRDDENMLEELEERIDASRDTNTINHQYERCCSDLKHF